MVKNPPAKAGNISDVGSIPGSQRVMPEVTEHSTSFSVLSCSTFFLSLDLKLVSYSVILKTHGRVLTSNIYQICY